MSGESCPPSAAAGAVPRREKLEKLEDLHYYENVYFWDIDFLHLDFFTEEELLASPVLEYMIIEKFFLFFNNIQEFKISGTRAENLCCLRNGWNDPGIQEWWRQMMEKAYDEAKEKLAGALL